MKKKFILSLLLIVFCFVLVACNSECPECQECETCKECEICTECETCEECKTCKECETCIECEICEECESCDLVKVDLGIDRIDEYLDIFEGKRVGLITNATGINSKYESTIDVLYSKVNLVALFAPEHGIRGAASAGESVGNEIDSVTGLTIYSLYGNTSTPTKEMLDQIDIMCIDIQDVGSRFYTYVYTMARAMKACKQYNKKFVVFDRPNPISGSEYEGNILDMNFSSGIGMYPIIQRHGLTIGEIANLFNNEYDINCNLTVIEMKGWTRELYIDETTVPWVLPSPNMPTVDTALVYPGTCIFEGSNLSEGRGTTRPFEMIGAPYIDAIELANTLNGLGLEGVYFRPCAFTPTTSKNSGKTCYGVQVHVTNRETFKAVKTGWTMLYIIRKMYPNSFDYTSTFNLLTGCDYFKNETYNLEGLYQKLEEDTLAFKETRDKYLIYK